jgi:hypothetical protein
VKFNRAECVSSDETNSIGKLAILAVGSQLWYVRVLGKVPVTGQKRVGGDENALDLLPLEAGRIEQATTQMRCSQTPSSPPTTDARSLFFNPKANPRCVRLLGIIKYLAVPNSLVSSIKVEVKKKHISSG